MKKLTRAQRHAVENTTIAVMFIEHLIKTCVTYGLSVSVYQDGDSLAPIFCHRNSRAPIAPVHFTEKEGLVAMRDASRGILRAAEDGLAGLKRSQSPRKGHRL